MTRKIMIAIIPALIFGAVIFSTYHVARMMSQYDGPLAYLLGLLLGLINVVGAYFAMEERRIGPRVAASVLMVSAAAASVWLQIRYYQAAGAGVDAYILGTWGPAAEIMLGLLYALLTHEATPVSRPATQRAATRPNGLGLLTEALADRIRPAQPTGHPATVGGADRPDQASRPTEPEPTDRLAPRPDSKEEAIDRLIRVVIEEPTISQQALADRVGRGKSTIQGYLAELEEAGQIHRNGNGIEVIRP